MVREVSANYTEMNIDYTFYDTNGKHLGLGGNANSFRKNGQGGGACCAWLPGPGQTVRVVWDEEPLHQDSGTTVHYSRDVVVTGSPPLTGDAYNYVITRFFPDHQIEVEFISEQMGAGRSSRLDRIFHGQPVMRHMGE